MLKDLRAKDKKRRFTESAIKLLVKDMKKTCARQGFEQPTKLHSPTIHLQPLTPIKYRVHGFENTAQNIPLTSHVSLD